MRILLDTNVIIDDVTRDKTGFVKSAITAIDPAEFFAQVERELGLSYAEVTLC